MRATVIQHQNHNRFRLTVRAEDNGEHEPSQVDNNFRNMQWMVKYMIQKNNNGFLATQLQSGITIRAMNDGSYHPTHKWELLSNYPY